MVTVSKRVKYAVMALVYMAQENSGQPVQIKALSETHAISHNYLEQLLGDLKRAQLLNSIRGRQGGYVLAKPASDIRLLDIVVAMEGPLQFSKDRETQAWGVFWGEIQANVEDTLLISLETVSLTILQYEGAVNYSI